MKYKIWNFGGTREIPWKNGPVCLEQNSGVTTKNAALAKYLSKFPRIKVTSEDDKNIEDMDTGELIAAASARGIKGVFGATKDALKRMLGSDN